MSFPTNIAGSGMGTPNPDRLTEEERERTDPDRLRNMAIEPPAEIFRRALLGEDPASDPPERASASGGGLASNGPSHRVNPAAEPPEGLYESVPDPREALGEKPERDRGREALMARLSLAGAAATALAGGTGLAGAIGRGLAQGGAVGFENVRSDYAARLKGWQKGIQNLAKTAQDARHRNADRTQDIFEDRLDAQQKERQNKATHARTLEEIWERVDAAVEEERRKRGLTPTETEQLRNEKLRTQIEAQRALARRRNAETEQTRQDDGMGDIRAEVKELDRKIKTFDGLTYDIPEVERDRKVALRYLRQRRKVLREELGEEDSSGGNYSIGELNTTYQIWERMGLPKDVVAQQILGGDYNDAEKHYLLDKAGVPRKGTGGGQR